MGDTLVDAAFFLPPLRRSSGGHRTALRYAAGLAAEGRDVVCIVEAAEGDPAALAHEVWPCPGVRFEAGFDQRVRARVGYATAWFTAPLVASVDGLEQRAYLVQDVEQWFHPLGEHALDAETSLDLGLSPVTLGRWLAHHVAQHHDLEPHVVTFGADTQRYRPGERVRDLRIAALYQPDKPRRLSGVLVRALAAINAEHPGAVIYLFGSDGPPEATFPHVFLGRLSEDDLAALYRECAIGVLASLTNPSRVPFEMMASGLPVVDVYRHSTLFDLPPPGVTLAVPSGASIAAAVAGLAEDPVRRAAAGVAATAAMAGRDLAAELAAFLAAHDLLSLGAAPPTQVLAPVYDEPPVVAAEDRSWAPRYVARQHRLVGTASGGRRRVAEYPDRTARGG